MPPHCSGNKETEYVVMDMESRSQRERHGAKFFVLSILLGHSDWNRWSGRVGELAHPWVGRVGVMGVRQLRHATGCIVTNQA